MVSIIRRFIGTAIEIMYLFLRSTRQALDMALYRIYGNVAGLLLRHLN